MWRCVLVLAVGWTGLAAADPVDEEPACELGQVRPQVIDLLGRDPFADRALRISTRRMDGGVTATVAIGESVRTIEARDCDEATAAIAVVIAVALRGEPPRSIDEPAFARPVELVVTAVPAPTSVSAEMTLGIAGGANREGWLAAVVPGARVARGAGSIGVALELRAPGQLRVEAMGAVRVTATAVTADACVRSSRVSLCGLAVGGWVRGRGEQLIDARTATKPILAAGARLGWEQPLMGGLGLTVHADVRANAVTSEFRVDGRPVWTSRRFEGWLGLGLIARIP